MATLRASHLKIAAAPASRYFTVRKLGGSAFPYFPNAPMHGPPTSSNGPRQPRRCEPPAKRVRSATGTAMSVSLIAATNGNAEGVPLEKCSRASFSILHGPQTRRISFSSLSERSNARSHPHPAMVPGNLEDANLLRNGLEARLARRCRFLFVIVCRS